MALFDLPPEILLEIGDRLSPSGKLLFSQTCSTLHSLVPIPKLRAIKVSALREGSIPVLNYLLEMGMKFTSMEFAKYLSVEKYETIEWLSEHLSGGFTIVERNRFSRRLAATSPDPECVRYGLSLITPGSGPFRRRLRVSLMVSVFCNPDHEMFDKVGLNLTELVNGVGPITVGRIGDLRLLRLIQRTKPFSKRGCIQCATGIILRPSYSFEMLDYLFDQGHLKLGDGSALLETAIIFMTLKGVQYCLKKKIPFSPDSLLKAFLGIRFTSLPRLIPLIELLLPHGLRIPENLFEIGHWTRCPNVTNIRYLQSKGALPGSYQLAKLARS